MKHINVNLTQDAIVKSLLLFALPILISNIFQQLYNTVDTMVIGNYLGELSLAAIGSSAVVFQLLVGFAIGMSSGLSIVAARHYGAEDNDTLKRAVAGALISGLIIVAVLTLISELFLHSLLQILNTPEDIIAQAYSYIHIITMFLGVMFFYNMLAGMLRAIGNSLMPLIFLIISSTLNIGLDLLLILKFGMGIKGAAIATVISQGISAVLTAIYILNKSHILIPAKKHFKPDKGLYKELIGQGLSMAMMGTIVTLGTVILQYSINNMGYLTIAGHITARRIFFFSLLPIMALSLSMSTFVSQNKGAGRPDRIIKGVKYAFIFTSAWGLLAAVIIMFTAEPLARFLSGSTNPQVLETASKYLKFNLLFLFVLGFLNTSRFTLQGLGTKIIPLVSSVIELAAKIAFVFFIIPSLGYWGVIISEPIIWIVMTVQLLFAYYRHPYISEYRANMRSKNN
ncbi:MAG: MATE family efflux transporter [Clostridia bacterium]|nr:MATE family efflux transporter [Clostridia bacterium]